MRVLVVGSSRFDETKQPDVVRAGRELGAELASRGHTILIGSDEETDIDPHVVAGATEGEASTRIEVHVPKGLEAQYTKAQSANITTVWHQFPNWDVTSMEVIRHQADAVLAVGGRLGVVHAGVSAWMLGKPVIPVGSFGGGSETVAQYGSSRRAEFYHKALDDAEIDRLSSPWGKGVDAAFVVRALERVAAAVKVAKISPRMLFQVLGLLGLALVLWVVFLTFPFVAAKWMNLELDENANFLLLFPTVCTAGLLGAAMQTLRALRDGDPRSGRTVVVDTALGVAAGMVSAILYLLAQVGVTGGVDLTMTSEDYVRVGIIVSMASLFTALYLDAALARFDRVRGSVMAGQYDGSLDPEDP